jgi:hypothetical protein
MDEAMSLKRKVGYVKLSDHLNPSHFIAFNVFDHDLILVVFSDFAAVSLVLVRQIPLTQFTFVDMFLYDQH